MSDTVSGMNPVEPEESLFEHHRIQVDPGQHPVRIDKFLASRLPGISRNRIQNASDADTILVNGKAVRSSYRIKPADLITIVLPYPPRDKDIKPENIPLDVVHEDEWLLVINKKAGMVVHPAHGNFYGTMMNALLHRFQRTDPEKYPFLVHRLDKNTSGVILVAKNEVVQAKLAKQFFDRTVEKKYVALVWGNVKNDTGIMKGNIGRNLKNRKIMDVFEDADKGKAAETHYRVIDRFSYVTLVELTPKTGRTHQIRVHLQHIGHPVFNDVGYGGDKILKGIATSKYRQFIENCFAILPRQALHAASIKFLHPESNKEVTFSAPLPDDFKGVVEKWVVE